MATPLSPPPGAPEDARNTRRFPRYEGYGFFCRLRSIGVKSLLTGDPNAGEYAPVFEIGEGGFGFLSKADLAREKDGVYRFALHSQFLDQPVSGMACVRYSIPNPRAGAYGFRVGVQFAEIQEKGNTRLGGVLGSERFRGLRVNPRLPSAGLAVSAATPPPGRGPDPGAPPPRPSPTTPRPSPGNAPDPGARKTESARGADPPPRVPRRHSRFNATGFSLRLRPAGLLGTVRNILRRKNYFLYEIGRGGFGFLSKRRFKEGTEFSGKVTTVYSSKPIDFKGEIRYSRPAEAESGFSYKVGVRFVEMASDGREEMARILNLDEMQMRVTYVPPRGAAASSPSSGAIGVDRKKLPRR